MCDNLYSSKVSKIPSALFCGKSKKKKKKNIRTLQQDKGEKKVWYFGREPQKDGENDALWTQSECKTNLHSSDSLSMYTCCHQGFLVLQNVVKEPNRSNEVLENKLAWVMEAKSAEEITSRMSLLHNQPFKRLEFCLKNWPATSYLHLIAFKSPMNANRECFSCLAFPNQGYVCLKKKTIQRSTSEMIITENTNFYNALNYVSHKKTRKVDLKKQHRQELVSHPSR